MEPIRDTHATFVDLLDRILDKGLVISADVVISVAGIPLIGVNLRAALAGMETMLKYGVMQAWDEKTKEWEKVPPSAITKESQAEEEDRETCPQCGNPALVKELLEKGCSECGWVSPRQKKKLEIIN